ncbi:histidine kinase [Elizabethkingia sp. JS20170427COW]|uniref:histidine kinase n=1 Tax=Elizabethkingia sp. JS20170427COW TaxID=2583851 RepID=UPI00110FFA2E|nr:histidine kinase [Elizabethkingia sp. JS20170427COW]QCX52436.1 histidine kinase [Elizabethkingia sp. JS20170427COW]
MQLKLKHSLSQKSIYLIALVVGVLVVCSLAVLSFLISRESRKNNEDFAMKSFERKYEALEREFLGIEEYQQLLKSLAERNNIEKPNNHFSILNELNHYQKLKRFNWAFQLNTAGKEELQKQILQQAIPKNQKGDFKWVKTYGSQTIPNLLVDYQDSLYWVNFDSLRSSQKTVYFGSTLNLDDLHEYLAKANQSQNNYAYIFTKNGICITHPEQKFIGKDVFSFTTLTAKDTLTHATSLGFTQGKTNSEYLNLEVTRFIKPLKTANFDGYIAVNYVNLLIDENVNVVRKYVAFFFIATFLLIVIVFVLFHKATNEAYLEKEKVEKEKNKLLIDNEKMHKKNAFIQLQQLKNQINPHFLFNSLNSLYMLIALDKVKAQRFTMNLSKIYRYLIVPPKGNLVQLKEELDFINQYMDLQKSRFQDELSFHVNINAEKALEKKLPYLALQVIVENALKHNIATIDQPLEIFIEINSDGLFVKNTYQLKHEFQQGEKFGLEYLQKTYSFFNKSKFYARKEGRYFICYLPLVE